MNEFKSIWNRVCTLIKVSKKPVTAFPSGFFRSQCQVSIINTLKCNFPEWSSCGWRFMSFFRKIMLDRGTHTSAQKRRTTPWGPSVCVGVSLSDHSVHEVDQITLKKKKKKTEQVDKQAFLCFRDLFRGTVWRFIYHRETNTKKRDKNQKW